MSGLVRSTNTNARVATPVTPVTPVTPIAQKAQQPTPSGNWQHPQFNEITRRQYATNFDGQNVWTIVINLVILSLSFVSVNLNLGWLQNLQYALLGFECGTSANSRSRSAVIDFRPYSAYIFWAARFVFVANIGQAVLPLIRRYYGPDDIADIPLTPSQREAMGLKPDVPAPNLPGSAYASPNYVTPPRYQRSTPRSSFGTPGERQSPFSGSPRANMGISTSNSPFSASASSPLFQKAVGGGSATKRLNYDSRESPLGNSSLFLDSSSSNTPSTPTPGTGRASVGLNNKWLYEKRRDSPRSSLFS
jgi:nucleoporin POM34